MAAIIPTDILAWQSLFDEHRDDHQMMSKIFTHALKLPLDDLFLKYIKYIKQSHPNFLLDAYQYSLEQLKFTFNADIYKEYLALLPVDEINKIRSVYKQCFSMPRSNLSTIWEFYIQFESKDVIGQKQVEEMAKSYERSKLLYLDVQATLDSFISSGNPEFAHDLMDLEHTNYCSLDDDVLHQRLQYLYLFCISHCTPSPLYWFLVCRYLILLHKISDTTEFATCEPVLINEIVVPFIPKSLNEWIPLYCKYIESNINDNLTDIIHSVPVLCLSLEWGYKCNFIDLFTNSINNCKEIKSVVPLFCLYVSKLLIHSDLTDMRSIFSIFRKWLNSFAQDATIEVLEVVIQCAMVFSTSAYVEHKHTDQFTIQARIFELGFKWLNSVISNQQTIPIVSVFTKYSKAYMEWLIMIKENENIKSLLTRLMTIIDRAHHFEFIKMVMDYCIANGECEWMYSLQTMIKEYSRTSDYKTNIKVNKEYNGKSDLFYYVERWNVYGIDSYECLGLKECATEQEFICLMTGKKPQQMAASQNQQKMHQQAESMHPHYVKENGHGSRQTGNQQFEEIRDGSSPLGMPNSDLVYGLLISLPRDEWRGPIVKVPELFAILVNSVIPPHRPAKRRRRA
eukprot:NODE_473_length_8033_cov_0.435216.p2 type:complete len:623 gc:universal NODE_473_length_8033_cov_0.435216:7680-5812(-)